MNNPSNNNDTNASMQSMGDVLSNMIQQLDSGNSAVAGQIREIGQVTASTIDRIATNGVSLPQSSAGSSTGAGLLNAFNPVGSSRGTNFLTSLFLGPVWKGIFSLFGRDSEESTAALSKFSFPENSRTDLSASLRADGQASGIRTDAFGLSQSTPVAQTPINISIQALDARSILDRSDDIAAALKQAMLSNHEINDNLNEL